MASMAWANVPANILIANWLGRSRRNGRTARGENWPMASWTTTIVMVSTRAVSDTMDAATVDRIMRAALGSPVRVRDTSSSPEARSIEIVTKDRTTPASTHITGTNHRLVFSRWATRKRRRLTAALLPQEGPRKPPCPEGLDLEPGNQAHLRGDNPR